MTTALDGLRAGEVAEAAGVNRQTLRYYERRGLLAEPARSPGGHRLSPAEAVTVLRVIKASQRLGFTLDDVAGLLDVSRHRRGKRPDAGLPAQAPGEARRGRGPHPRPHPHPRQAAGGAGRGMRRPDRLRRVRLLPHPVRRAGRRTPDPRWRP